MRIQYTMQSPFAAFFGTLCSSSKSWSMGGDASTLAAFSAVAILLGRNLTSARVFFIALPADEWACADEEE